MVDTRTVEDKLRGILVVELGKRDEIDKLRESDSLAELGLSSASLIRVVVALENAFDFEFADDDLNFETFLTVGSVVKYVTTHVS